MQSIAQLAQVKTFLGHLVFLEQGYQILFGTLITGLLTIILVTSVPVITNNLRFVAFFDIAVIFMVYAYLAVITPFRYQQSIFEISVIETLTNSGDIIL